METKFSVLFETGKDADATTVSASLEIKENYNLCFDVLANTGTHSTHVVTLQISSDDSTWTDTAHIITGVGIKDNVQTAARYVRLKVTTNEGAASTVDWHIQAK